MSARRLTLLRHGAAESPDLWAVDIERPLTRRGVAEIEEAAQRLVQRQWIPQLILASPSERTWSSAQILAGAFDLEDSGIRCVRDLYLATAETLWAVVARQPPTLHHLLICGHNPGLSDLASRFGHHPRRRDLGTAGVARVTCPDLPWDSLGPRSALRCDFDEPEGPAAG